MPLSLPVEELKRTLGDGLVAMGLACSEQQVNTLIAYIQLLSKWNHVYNLTAVRDPVAMVVTHLLDSLSLLVPTIVPAIASFFPVGKTVLDVGAGAGLPGFPLAIVRDDLHLIELESSNKKARFMQQAVLELKLRNVTVACARVERYQPDVPVDIIVSRAFASLAQMLTLTGHLCSDYGDILAMKGKPTDEELTSLPPGYRIASVTPLTVPGLGAPRHLVHITKIIH